jgi:acetoacetyl-CoA synthetase
MDDFTIYNGKRMDLRVKMAEIVHGMKDDPEFKGMVSMPRFNEAIDISSVPRTETLKAFISAASTEIPPFERTAFRDPFLIAYSSGTTGTPKCIVHSVGGCLLSGAKEAKIHREITHQSVALQYTTTGWIMYFSSISKLVTGAHVILYDGSPFVPDITTFVRMVGELGVTMLGTSPRWMHELSKNGVKPREVTDLSKLTIVTSTGMVLSEQLFEWFYDVGFPNHVHLANISGGTDLVSQSSE